MPSPRQVRVLTRGMATRDALKKSLSSRWLEIEYRNGLYGGWIREDTSLAPPHRKAIQFHEASKAQFCGWCHHYVGQIGSDEDQKFPCPSCKEISVIPPKNDLPGDWLLSGPSFSKHFPLTLNPYFEQAMGSHIVDKIKNQQKVVTQYLLDSGDRVHCLSYEQYLKSGKDQTNPYEGPRWKGALFDEPPPREVWIATKRGLLLNSSRFMKPPFTQVYQTIFIGGGNQSSKSWTSRAGFCGFIKGEQPWDGSLSRHYGRTIFAATPLECPWMFHEIYQKAWNKGGDNKSVYAIEFDITDNPALTPKAIAQFAEGLSPEEKEARLHGRFKHLSGRVFGEWDPEIHIYDPDAFDPLREHYNPKNEDPSGVPVFLAVDPHYRKPWFMLWTAIMPDGSYCVFDEWPCDGLAFEKLKSCSKGFDEYAELLREKEESFPGGAQRVMWREFDPNLANTPHTTSQGSTTYKDEMRTRQFYFRTDVNDKIHFGHSLIHTLLKWDSEKEPGPMNRPMLLVSEKCRNMIFAFDNYTWDNHSDLDKALKDKPKDLGKDPMDTLRYTVARQPRFIDWRNRSEWYQSQANKAHLRAGSRRPRRS